MRKNEAVTTNQKEYDKFRLKRIVQIKENSRRCLRCRLYGVKCHAHDSFCGRR